MESIDILTGQNVIIRYQSATVLQRAFARILDYFFIFVFLFSFHYFFWNLISKYFNSDVLIILTIVFWLPAFSYHFLFESILGGKTPGKMIVKIKVTNIDGSIPSIGSYLLRWLLSMIDILFFGSVGAIFIIFSKNHQRLGDIAAGTIVVKTNPKLSFDLDESFYVFPDDYEPSFLKADKLTEGQIAFITNILVEPVNKDAMSSPVKDLANKVKTLLNIDSDLDDRKFLETIVRDYNYYAALEI